MKTYQPFTRGCLPDDGLKPSYDRKVSPVGWEQKAYTDSRGRRRGARWVSQVPNSFGLPAGDSCPGLTPFCDSCYAVGSENSKGVNELVMHNFVLLKEAGTIEGMAELLRELIGRYKATAKKLGLPPKDWVFRIHWDGDFFSIEYAQAWAIVMLENPDVQFWAYTRSFRGKVNVVPFLSGIPNLALYLSADEYNMADALKVVEAYRDVSLAICAEDYRSARELVKDVAGRRTLVCPENDGRMELMENGRGACVTCQLCPGGKADIIFSTSHREDATSQVMLDLPTTIVGRCANPECNNPIRRQPGRGRPPKWCSSACRNAVYYANKKAKENEERRVVQEVFEMSFEVLQDELGLDFGPDPDLTESIEPDLDDLDDELEDEEDVPYWSAPV